MSVARRNVRAVARCAWLALGWTMVGGAQAQAACERPVSFDELAPQWIVRLDNDLFSGTGQDRGYTNGLLVARVSRDLMAQQRQDCLPSVTQWFSGAVRALEPQGVEQRNVVVQLAQGLFTPADPAATEVVRNDRPYAGLLLAGVGYNSRAGQTLHVTQFHAGWVGPAALGEFSQRLVHRLIGSAEFQGWDHQLRNEPLLLLVHERLQRHALAARAPGDRWRSDLITHAGASMGNLLTELNAGVEWRWGLGLPDDFGSHPMRPAGNNMAPVATPAAAGGAGAAHLFVALDVQRVWRDLTLDGNTWRASHSVERRSWMAEAGIGVAFTTGRWKLAFARYLRTREFDGQAQRPALGSMTVGYRLD